jgi:protein-arginine kinase/protein-arginine kinase activator protein McsA
MVFIRRTSETDEGCDIVLCEECAKSRGIIAGNGSLDLNIDDLIGVGLDPSSSLRPQLLACPSCGLALPELLRTRRLGCAACADAFFPEITRALGRRLSHAAGEEPLFIPIAKTASSAANAANSKLEAELKSALAGEDYERATQLRDELSPAFPSDFPLALDSFGYAKGKDDDVVLWSSAKVYRDSESLPFPGSPKGSPSPSRDILHERLLSNGSWSSRSMSGLSPAARRSLAERGLLPRGYAADGDAVLLSKPKEGCYALLDEGDHLRLTSIRSGFDLPSALSTSLAEAELIGRDFPFAYRPDFGWICSRLDDCGLGAYLCALVHLPALAAVGMRDRLFRALIADGVALRGFYSMGEESSGSVYEIGVEASAAVSLSAMAEILVSAIGKVVQAERRARAETAARPLPALADAEGRAFGIIRHCGILGAEESASLVSTLRLAALRGTLAGVDPRTLGSLLVTLGTGSVAFAQGLDELPEPEAADFLRARHVKAALANAEYSRE